MKFMGHGSAILLFCTLSCAGPHSTMGRDFDSDQISHITKGETTDQELLSLLGEPVSKLTMTDNEEQWVYTYSDGTAQKRLDIMLKNGVIVNYTYKE